MLKFKKRCNIFSKDFLTRIKMTTYATREDYLRDQISSFKKAKKILKQYKTQVTREVEEDFRGDKEKVLKGVQKGIKYLDSKKEKIRSELNILKN